MSYLLSLKEQVVEHVTDGFIVVVIAFVFIIIIILGEIGFWISQSTVDKPVNEESTHQPRKPFRVPVL